jgi:putative transposase
MTSSNNMPNRQSCRMSWHNYTQAGYYFVTICTQDRYHAFGRIIDAEVHLSREGRICEHVWRSLPERFANVAIDEMVLMPNHVHGIIMIKKPPVFVETSKIPERFKDHMRKLEEERMKMHPETYRSVSVGQIVRTFKAASTRLIRKHSTPSFAWQRSYWLAVLPTKEHLERIRHYIQANPAAWQNDALYTIEEK